MSRSESARQAIVQAAERERRRTGLAAEAAALADDPAYVAEAAEVAALMEQLRDPGVTSRRSPCPAAADGFSSGGASR